MDKKHILEHALNHYTEYCQGFSFPGKQGDGYIMTPLLGVGKDRMKFFHQGSTLLDQINVFDQAETDGPYIGQINLIQVSSFCGPNGLLWGYDVAVVDKEKPVPELVQNIYHNIQAKKVKVYSAWPFIEATQALYGTIDNQQFPILPGSHVPAAWKSYSFCNLPPSEESKHLYCSFALGIPTDRDKNAILLMEDVGWVPRHGDKADFREQYEYVIDALIRSVLQIGENQAVTYESIYVALKEIMVHPGEVGCALVAAPYVTLPSRAIPPGGAEQMLSLNLEEWQAIIQTRINL